MARRQGSETVQISVRAKEPLRAALESAAAERGVSMNTEIIERLMRTFEDEVKLEAEFDRRQLYAILRIAAVAMDHSGNSAVIVSGTRSNWVDNPFAYDQAVKAALHVLNAFRPLGEISGPKSFPTLGEDFAGGILEHIAAEEPISIGDASVPPRSHRELGHLIARLRHTKEQRR
jgi:hypothetical protein